MIVPLAAGGMLSSLDVGWTTLAALLLLFAASFFFSGTETALFALQKVDREWVGRHGRTGQLVARLLSRRAPLITTVLLGNETANVGLAATGAALVAALAPSSPWLNVLLLTPVLVLVSEVTPKVLAFRSRRTWARLAAWPLAAFYVAASPVRWLLSGLVGLLARLLGADGEAAEGDAEEELMVYVDRGAASGELARLERDIIEAVFEFDDLTVERLMTPRPDVFSVPLTLSWEALFARCGEAGHSRIPVTGGRTDDIVGVLLLKDLLKFREVPFDGPRQLRSVLLPPTFVPASKSADAMLREFLERRIHMAFVVDEHGTFVGLVTLDDLLDELLGEDEASEESEIERVRPDALTVKASIDVEDFAEETGIELPDGDYHTLGGFVFHGLGRLPRTGDALTWEGHRFVVSEMEGRRIAEVLVQSPLQRADEEAVG